MQGSKCSIHHKTYANNVGQKSLNMDKCLLLSFPLFFLKLISFVVKIMMLVSSRLDKVLFFLLELLDERHLGT